MIKFKTFKIFLAAFSLACAWHFAHADSSKAQDNRSGQAEFCIVACDNYGCHRECYHKVGLD